MCTSIRPTISKKSPYYISKDRYYELKHFCLQYKDFKRRIALEASKMPLEGVSIVEGRSTYGNDRTGDLATNLALYKGYIRMIEDTCSEAGGDIKEWLFKSVTEGKSYAVLCPPCSKDYFYQRYRRFYWELDKVR